MKNKSKVVVITGASSGIGLAAAKLFALNGYKVYGVSLDKVELDFSCVQIDVNDSQKIREFIEGVYQKEGRIDVFVNNAGYGIAGELLDNNVEDVKKMISTDLSAYIANMIIVGNIMKKQKSGKIINVCSLSAIFPLPYQACYSAAKAGIDVISRTARTELKPYGIFVSEVLPGDVKTGFTDARVKNESKNKKINLSVKKMEGYEKNGMSPTVVAKKIYNLANKKRPRARVCVGSLKLLVLFQKILPTRFLDYLISKIYC